MNIFNTYSTPELFKLLTVPEDAAPAGSGPDQDLIVGRSRRFEIRPINGSKYEFRDIIVLGELTITPSPSLDSNNRPKINFRNLIIAGGSLTGKGIELTGKCALTSSDKEFQASVHEVVIERFRMQREDVARIGLRSIQV